MMLKIICSSLEVPFFPLLWLSLVKRLQKSRWSLLLVASPPLVFESADAVISKDFLVGSNELVQVTTVNKVPFSFVNQFVSLLNFSVNCVQVSHRAMLSEMVGDKDFSLKRVEPMETTIVFKNTFHVFAR